MTRSPCLLAGLVLAAILSSAAVAEPALVYSVGGRFDGSFNEAAWRGAERFAKETGESYRDFEIARDADSLQALRSFAARGLSPVVAIGFNQASAVDAAAKDYPQTSFSIVDMVVEAPNVRSVVFREHEGAYIAGLLAAMASQTGTIGFVGGMDIPIIRRFLCGYRQGAASISADTRVLFNMAGDTPAAFADPARGAELARSQIARGADVVIQAAGGTGIGVLQAVADAGKLGIGTDSNQNGLHPGKVLTSIRKRVDVAVHRNFSDARDGKWSADVQVLGLAEGGMDWVIDADNRKLVTPAMEAAARAAETAISEGRIQVHDAASDGECPL
ncbi:BMP family ABC transporter substrate-binding protein [Stappia sp. MMSF_3263]|uniref:BMP family ABC transporter substrate-binding protein n=1 Tax=Stappia sp. MMSF_3263 TaxID=3046693 RepID=UPI00273EAA94|nr:BMP family ABC transporter substrate-binding protein [Stappia sp. MMSF_3263]